MRKTIGFANLLAKSNATGISFEISGSSSSIIPQIPVTAKSCFFIKEND